MKYIVDVKPSIEAKIRQLLEKGEFSDFNHFANIAIENQILAETGQNAWTLKNKNITHNKSSTTIEKARKNNSLKFLERIKMPKNIKTLSEPLDKEIITGPLWGQFYKFIPAKVGLRILLNLNKENMPFTNDFREIACEIAEAYREKLEADDKKKGRKLGHKLSSGFPTKNPKSRKRYMDQYLLYIRPTDYKLDGMLARLKFINVVEENGSFKVGITKSGLIFANLENPIIDSGNSEQPLSEEEVKFLIGHINKKLNSEGEHIATLLMLLNEGVDSRESLNNKMATFYKKFQMEENPWTEGMINTMRSGLMSRLFEFGFIQKKKQGLNVYYGLTEKGKIYLSDFKIEVKDKGV